jgi:hypothetical protein
MRACQDSAKPENWCGDRPITTFFFPGDYYQPPTTTLNCPAAHRLSALLFNHGNPEKGQSLMHPRYFIANIAIVC